LLARRARGVPPKSAGGPTPTALGLRHIRAFRRDRSRSAPPFFGRNCFGSCGQKMSRRSQRRPVRAQPEAKPQAGQKLPVNLPDFSGRLCKNRASNRSTNHRRILAGRFALLPVRAQLTREIRPWQMLGPDTSSSPSRS